MNITLKFIPRGAVLVQYVRETWPLRITIFSRWVLNCEHPKEEAEPKDLRGTKDLSSS